MFKQKPKLDPKVRFQRSSFKKELSKARGYRRRIPAILTEGSAFQKAIARVGLGNVWLQILLLLVLGGLIYLLYIPNFLYIRSVSVSGFSDENKLQVEAAAKKYLNDFSFAPRKHFLFVRPKELKKFVARENPSLLVDEVTRDWPHTIFVRGREREAAYALEAGNRQLLLSEDGMIIASHPLEAGASSTPGQTLPKLILTDITGTQVGEILLRPSFAEAFRNARGAIASGIGSDVRELAPNYPSNEFTATTQAGVKFLLVPGQDPTQLESKIRLLAGDLNAEQKRQLVYVDLRLEARGFVCLKGQACSRPPEVPVTGTSTPASTSTPAASQ